MTNREEIDSPELKPVFVETNLDTRIVILAHIHESISDFSEKFCKYHQKRYPKIGEINISALKVERRGCLYDLCEYMSMSKAFQGIKDEEWFLYADVERVEKRELVAIMAADEQREIADGSVLVDGNTTKCLAPEAGLEKKVVEKKTKKRKIESSADGNRSRKKSKINFSQSAVATSPLMNVANESRELGGNVQIEVTESLTVSPRDKSDDILADATVKDIESGEKNQQTSDADMLCQEKSITIHSKRVNERTRDEVKDAQANETHKEALETDESQKSRGEVPSKKLDDLAGGTEEDLGKVEETAGLAKIDQEMELEPTLELVDERITSRDDVTESHEALAEVQVGDAPELCDTLPREKRDDILSKETDIGRGEESSLAPGAADTLQTAGLVTYQETQLEASSGLTTGPATAKKRKRKKSSKDDINKSIAAATTTSREIVNEINGVPEIEMGEKSVKDVGRDNIENDNLVSYPAQLEANSGLTSGPVSEKKRKRKKSSKDDINQSSAAATTASREIVTEINEVTGNVDRVDTTSESLAVSESGSLSKPLAKLTQKENEMGDKIDDDAEIGRAIPGAADNIVSYPENQLGVSSGLTTGTATEKKKRRKKSSKDHINQSPATATTVSREIVNEMEKVSGSIDHVNAPVETIQTENEMFVEKVGSIEATPNVTDEIQAENNVQVADLATTLPALVEESKTVDHNGKSTDDKRTPEHDVAKENGGIDADKAKSVKSTKKKKSRKTKIQAADLATTLPALVQESKTLDHIGESTNNQRTLEHAVVKDNGEVVADEPKSVKSTKKKKQRKTKTPAIEDTLVDSGPQNVEPFKVVDGEGPDNVIRNVLDSLQQRNETEESLDKVEKKTSKRSKKKVSSNIVDSQVLSVEVNNAAQEAAPPLNNPEGTDASWTSVKKVTESKRIEVADINCSQQTQQEKADMGDNFGSRQKDETVVGGKKQGKVTGGAKSKEEKKILDLRPCGSIDGLLSSMKPPKERNSRAQPASSGTASHLKSRARSVSKVDNSITSVKKSSNSVTVNKNNKLNFFKDAECNSSDDESYERTTPHVSTTKTPPDSSSDEDSDVTSMSRKQGNNLPGGAFKFTGSFQDIVRSSRSYKKAKETLSQCMSDDETPAIDIVPDSQAN